MHNPSPPRTPHHHCYVNVGISPSSIQPRPPAVNISFHHNSPALTSEYYAIQLSVQNTEDDPISDLQVAVALPDYLEENQPAGTVISIIVSEDLYRAALCLRTSHTFMSSFLCKGAAGPETSKQPSPSLPLSPPVELYDSIPVTPLGQKQRHSLDLVAGELASAAKVSHMVVT